MKIKCHTVGTFPKSRKPKNTTLFEQLQNLENKKKYHMSKQLQNLENQKIPHCLNNYKI